MSNDNLSKVDSDVLSFLKDKKCLLLEPLNSTRSAQKKILMNLGCPVRAPLTQNS